MKRHVLLVGFIFLSGSLWAQNKTLGVGVTTPNSNAALHVESPTGNQGFILPRLTTAQRTATGFTSVLGVADNGLMVYDTNLQTIFIWDGAKWKSSAQVAGGPKLVYPYVDTVASAPNNANLLRLLYAGSAAENVGVAHFENLNPNNGFSAIFGRTNSVTNGAADLVVNNPANTNDALGVTTNGLGRAGSFSVNNASNQSAALHVSTNGTPGATAVNSAAILGETTTAFSAITALIPPSASTSNAISGITKSTDAGSWAGYFDALTGTAVYGTTSSNVGGPLAPVGVYGEARGTGSVGGAFWIQNATNTFPALYSNTIGMGPSLSVNLTNASNPSPAVVAQTNGLGHAARFTVNNASATVPALWVQTNSTQYDGIAVRGLSTGGSSASYFTRQGTAGTPQAAMWAENNSVDGYGAYVESINSGNGNPALYATTNGTGPAIEATTTTGWTAIMGEAGGSGNGVFGRSLGSNAAISGETTTGWTAIHARQLGTAGSAGFFNIENSASTHPAISAATDGAGSAANFQINNPSNTLAALHAQTNGTGPGISANNTSTGDAVFALKSGSSGSAGNFQINNGSNPASALFAMTNAGGGSSIGAMNTGNGNALTIFNGGVRVSVESVSSGTIANRAAAYRITGGGPSFTFGFGTSDGEVFMVFNDSGVEITVQDVAIPTGEGRTIIQFAPGVFRGF
ncbi:MAG TPA: hypothetical protein VGD40_25835 [Chryseosolibacter sp.]